MRVSLVIFPAAGAGARCCARRRCRPRPPPRGILKTPTRRRASPKMRREPSLLRNGPRRWSGWASGKNAAGSALSASRVDSKRSGKKKKKKKTHREGGFLPVRRGVRFLQTHSRVPPSERKRGGPAGTEKSNRRVF
ncbi:MAG: hypothetical protein BJ554DRAFT_2097 [Olpidium bornovanus]|uniref:Uncharacterized protein n=1 Tax=Olpidium bornovanus TaxID=278681 RepID=A0A8H8DM93_9FUNG|nr:MAG: hypothetical protein BJ554DRAFT_2097 [Olpidium bornovanus]